MKTLVLGKTGLTVTKTALGCLPLQRCTEADAVDLIRAAFDGGITYFDTANAYSDSEKKLGLALSGVRSRAVISTKSGGADKKTVTAHIENSLRLLRTDYIDLLQFHNPAALSLPVHLGETHNRHGLGAHQVFQHRPRPYRRQLVCITYKNNPAAIRHCLQKAICQRHIHHRNFVQDYYICFKLLVSIPQKHLRPGTVYRSF